jgi:hypothetical protein
MDAIRFMDLRLFLRMSERHASDWIDAFHRSVHTVVIMRRDLTSVNQTVERPSMIAGIANPRFFLY